MMMSRTDRLKAYASGGARAEMVRHKDRDLGIGREISRVRDSSIEAIITEAV
jgi:hypothetical protein